MRFRRLAFTPGAIPTLATLVLLSLLVTLGLWQLDRAGEKERLLAEVDAQRSAPATSLEAAMSVPGGLAGIVYRAVRARGRFDGDRQYLLDNRTRGGVAGYDVYTPLRLEASRMALLANRGWVPVGSRRDRLPPLPVPDGVREVRGIIAPLAPPPPVLGETGYGSGAWPRVVQRLEPETIGREIGMALPAETLVLDEGAPGTFVRDWRPVYGISPDRHRGYALQWFSLALALVVIYAVVNTRRIDAGAD